MTGVYVMVAAWWAGLGLLAWWMLRRDSHSVAAAKARLETEAARRADLITDLHHLADQAEQGLFAAVMARRLRALLAQHSREQR